MNAHDINPAAAFRQLDAGMAYRLTLVLASNGTGTSALVHRWLERRNWPAAWVDLGAGDNHLVGFVQHLMTVSQHLIMMDQNPTSDYHLSVTDENPRPGRTGAISQHELKPRQDAKDLAAAEDAFAGWINSLARVAEDFCLVLDGYDWIEAPAVHRAVRQLLDYPPPHMHTYIVACAEPPLQLPRLRVRRQLLEVRLA